MTTLQHTPGPWEANHAGRKENGAAARIEHRGSILAYIVNANSESEYEANARLIAAAPELLAALREVVGEWDEAHADEDNRTGFTPDTGGIAFARIIIAKATQS